MYYELGTMVAVMKNATPFANHEKGISIPSNDVVGEIIGMHPSTLSYTVRLSKYFTLVFSEDDIYGLPGWMSDKRYLFHKMLGCIIQAVPRSFYSVKEFENFVNLDRREKEKQSTMYFPNYKFDPKFMENMMYPVKSSLAALEELNRREVERIAAEPIRIDIDDAIKANYSKEEIKKMINKAFGVPKFEYKKIIFNGPCTIILWKDGTKTIAKASDGEMFDPEKGVAICFMKRALGETEGKKVLRKANKDFYDEVTRAANEELKKSVFPLPKGVTFRPFTFDKPIDNNNVIKVEKVEEDHKMDFRACMTCKYANKPVTDNPCYDCTSKNHYEKGDN